MSKLVRCRPCGYVMKEDDLGDVCPACGLPRKVFEPYRERVSDNRLLILNLDLHPIAIHLSQTFVALIPLLLLTSIFFPDFYGNEVKIITGFLIYFFPLTIIAAFITGALDGMTRFKSLKPPLLRKKVILSVVLLVNSFLLWTAPNLWDSLVITLLISSSCLVLAVILGLIGKSLLNVILPGTYPMKKGGKRIKKAPEKTNTEE